MEVLRKSNSKLKKESTVGKSVLQLTTPTFTRNTATKLLSHQKSVPLLFHEEIMNNQLKGSA
jgi:hypothetical protein